MGLGQIQVNWKDSLLQLSLWRVSLTFRGLGIEPAPAGLSTLIFKHTGPHCSLFRQSGLSTISCPACYHLLTFSSLPPSLAGPIQIFPELNTFSHNCSLCCFHWFSMPWTTSSRALLIGLVPLLLWFDASGTSVSSLLGTLFAPWEQDPVVSWYRSWLSTHLFPFVYQYYDLIKCFL